MPGSSKLNTKSYTCMCSPVSPAFVASMTHASPQFRIIAYVIRVWGGLDLPHEITLGSLHTLIKFQKKNNSLSFSW